ncbi:hypothetical protein ACFL0V_02170 [Nanoarchaeota archaeon]
MRKKKKALAKERIECYVTKEEKILIESKADAVGLSMSTFVKLKILDKLK